MKKFYVGVKGLIQTDQGYLILKHAKGHYDVPGGRIDGNEDFEQTLLREFSEELPGSENIVLGELIDSFRIQKDIDDDISLVLLYFLVSAKLPDPIQLSDEHQNYQWIKTADDIPDGLNAGMDSILRRLL